MGEAVMRKPTRRVLVIAAMLLGLGLWPTGQTSATVILFNASLDGAQEVPSVATTGTGSAAMSFDTATNLFSWTITWSGLTGSVFAVHFHNAPAGVNGAIVISGLGTTSPEIGSIVLSGALFTELLAAGFYINVHTDDFPAGEIRGQVRQVPEPSTLAIFAFGLAGLGFMTRRRRRVLAA